LIYCLTCVTIISCLIRELIFINDREILELLLHKVTSIESDVSTLKTDVSTTKTDVSTLKTDVTTLRTEFDSLVVKIDTIFEQTARLSEYHEETTLKLDLIIEDQKSIHEIIGEHEVANRTLRRRAV
jgi:regulator of replication initiation timing